MSVSSSVLQPELMGHTGLQLVFGHLTKIRIFQQQARASASSASGLTDKPTTTSTTGINSACSLDSLRILFTICGDTAIGQQRADFLRTFHQNFEFVA
jgi:hypothetical protein